MIEKFIRDKFGHILHFLSAREKIRAKCQDLAEKASMSSMSSMASTHLLLLFSLEAQNCNQPQFHTVVNFVTVTVNKSLL